MCIRDRYQRRVHGKQIIFQTNSNQFLKKFAKMPKEITDIRKFLQLTKEEQKQTNAKIAPKKKVLYIKYGKRATKFKLRGARYLYTCKIQEKEKAQKLLSTLPSTLQKVEIKSKKIAKNKKKK
eukprot:TRINITY_DN929_c0_g2_i2.p3 TRINITY_DN929_c0_g2~~TRINITY_DN929_c0_g2_i2.p3  ORF type:complete len:123 (+),score=31.34 TRINITY_DN929_c0_g2_i2:77-445(+)